MRQIQPHQVATTSKPTISKPICLSVALNIKRLSVLTSLVVETGQAVSTHDTACVLGFGASAICPITVFSRILENTVGSQEILSKLSNYQKAINKALMKTMGKFGLCTAEAWQTKTPKMKLMPQQ